MKQLFCLLLVCVFANLSAQAQPYGNEWIDYSKTYHKIKLVGPGFPDFDVQTHFIVGQHGLTRIDYATLQSKGLAGLSGNGFKVFNKGREIPIYVSTSGTLGPSDYIEFFWEENDGEYDKPLFEEADWQVRTDRSLFSDEARYFLTWDDSTPSSRYIDVNNNITNTLPKEDYFMYTSKVQHLNIFHSGEPTYLAGANQLFSDYGKGEGFTLTTIGKGGQKNLKVATKHAYINASAPSPVLEMKIIGSNDDFKESFDHHVRASINGTTYIDEVYKAYDIHTYSTSIQKLDIDDVVTRVLFESVGDLADDDKNSPVYTSITYPHTFNFDGRNGFRFTLENNDAKYLEIENFDGGSQAVLYDLTNNLRLQPLKNNDLYKIQLPAGASNGKRDLMIINTTSTDCNLSYLSRDCFECAEEDYTCFSYTTELEETQFTDFSKIANQGDFLLVANSRLRTGGIDYVEEYANYRASEQGGGYTPVIIDVDELYDQFAWGIKTHPLSIRNFINFAMDTWQNDPGYMLLLGKSVSYHKLNLSENLIPQNLVPSYGHNASDVLLAARATNEVIPQLAIGRIPAMLPSEVKNYLDKVIEYEAPKACTIEDRAWIKNIAHVSLGASSSENSEYSGYLNNYKDIVEGADFYGDVLQTFRALKDVGNLNGLKPLMEDDGLGLVTFFGHSGGSGSSWAVQGIGEGDPEYYENTGRYPFIISASCFVGNIHTTSNETMAEQYTVTADHGSIGFMATVSFGMPIGLDAFCERLYEEFSLNNYGQPMGYCMKRALERMPLGELDPDSDRYEAYKLTMQQFTLAGDPAVILGGFTRPEYLINGDVKVFLDATNVELTGSPIVTNADDLNFQVTVNNIGRGVSDNFTIQVNQQLPNGTIVTVGSETVAAPALSETYTIPVTIDDTDLSVPNTFSVVINQGNSVLEDCYDNNSTILQIQKQEVNCADLTSPTLSIPQSSLCIEDGAINITASLGGGTFNGNGVSGTSFNPANAGVGNHLITYNYTDPTTGCQLFATASIEVIASPAADISSSSQRICSGESLTISADNYDLGANYNWSFGADAQVQLISNEQYSVSWSTAGAKNITLQTSKGSCSSTAQNIVIQVEAPLARPLFSCGGSTLDLVEFLWEPVVGATGYGLTIDGDLINLGADATAYAVTGISEGQEITATIIAYGTGACGNSPSSFSLSCKADNCPTRNVEIQGLQSSYCLDAADVALEASEAGGQFFVNGLPATTFSPSELGQGSFVITYELNQGACNYEAVPVEVMVNLTPVVEIFGNNNFCEGESTIFEASAGFASYLWSNGSTSSSITVTSPDTYIVTVTDANGCTGIQSIVALATEIETPLIDADGKTAICEGELIILSVPDVYSSYLWENNGSIESSLLINGPGTYNVTVTNDGGCESFASITLEEAFIETPMMLVDGVEAAEENLICAGGQTITLGMGTDYTNYLWSTGETSAEIDITQAGTFEVTVTNSNGCRTSNTVTISEKTIEAPVLSIDGGESNFTEVCFSEYVEHSFELNVGGDFESFVWSNGATTPTITVTPSQATTYEVTVTNSEGCNNVSSFEIGNYIGSIDAPLEETINICQGDSVVLEGDAVFTIWSSGETSSSITVGEEGVYYVNRIDEAGCSMQEYQYFVEVKESALLDVSATATSICSGDETTINASDGFDTYTWIETGETTASITVSQAGTYTVEAVSNDCVKVESITIIEFEPKLEALNITADRTEICVGEEIELRGEGLANAASFDWRGEGLSSTNSETVIANPTGAGTYTLIATDENGCAKRDTIAIELNQVCDLPNAITPRTVDGRNDTWIIPQAYTNSNVGVSIFNRWGQKVWDTTAYNNDNGWNGTNMNGKELSLGTYYFIIDLNDNQTDVIHGAITILE